MKRSLLLADDRVWKDLGRRTLNYREIVFTFGSLQQAFLTLKGPVALLEGMPAHGHEFVIQTVGLRVQHCLFEHVDPLGHRLTLSSLEFLPKELLHLSFLRGDLHARGT